MKLMTKSFVVCICFIMTFIGQSNAQNSSIEDVMKVNLRNSGPIVKGKQVTGYYFFYKKDKIDRKTNSYILQILDQNLEKVSSKTITESKNIVLLEGDYNGEAIMLKFYDTRERILKMKMYDLEGKSIRSSSKELSRMEAALMLGPNFNEDETQKSDVNAIDGKGFVTYTPTKGKGSGYEIKFTSSTKGEKGWKKTSNVSEKGFKIASYIAYNDKILISSLIKKKSAMTRDMTYFIVGHDMATGKELFEEPLVDSNYKYQLMNGYQAKDGSFAVLGTFYEKDAKLIKAKSLGIASFKIDASGKITDKKTVKWSKAKGFLPIDDKGRVDKLGHIYFHKFIQTADGRVYGIGESYKKAASGGGIAVAALGGRASLVKMVVEDMIIFEFDDNFDLKGADIFDKSKTNLQLPEGGGLYSPHLLALYMNALGGFDYSFTQEATDGSYFIVGYVDYEKIKGEKNKYIFGAISNVDGEYNTDKISLKSDASDLRVLPAKNGHILILEYFKKEKKMNMRIEKINF